MTKDSTRRDDPAGKAGRPSKSVLTTHKTEMVTRNTTKRKPRTGSKASKGKPTRPAGNLETIKQERFIAEQVKLDGSESPYFLADRLAMVSRRPMHCIEEAMWMKQICSPGKPCSPRLTCELHLEHVALWSNQDFQLTALEGSDRHQRDHDLQRITRQPFFKQTEKMKERVNAHPEEWPSDLRWRTSQIEFRDAVNRIVGTNPHRAAALNGLLRMLRVTPNTPANFQHKMATMAIETTWILQGLFEKAMNMGISIEELYEADPWSGGGQV